LPLLLDILTDCLYQPTFPTQYLEMRRGQILTAIEQRRQSTRSRAALAFSSLMYPDHPYSISQLGYQDSIEALTRKDMTSFYANCYGAHGMGVTIVGGVSCEKGLDLLEQALGEWRGANYVQSPLPPCQATDSVQKKTVLVPGKAQSDILIGWLAMKRTDPGYVPAYLADCILGQFGLMGRLGSHVRQEKGLAYYAYSGLEAGIGPGPWSAAAGVDPANVERAIESILHEIRRLQQEPVDEQELDDNKSYIIGSLPLRLESNEGIAAQIIEMQIYDLGLDHARRFLGRIAALTAQDVLEIANAVLNPEAYVLTVAGPSADPGT
jgi:zinc protease